MRKHYAFLSLPLFCILVLALSLGCYAEETKHLSLERLYSSPYLWGTSPSRAIWSKDNRHIAFLWNDKGELFKDLWIYTLGEKKPRKLTDMKRTKPRTSEPDTRTDEEKMRAERLASGVSSMAWSPDNNHILFSYMGDIFLVDIGREETKRLTDTKASEGEIGFSPDGRYISFAREGDIWLLNSEEYSLRQLTKSGKKDVTNSRYQWAPDSTKISFVFTNSTKASDIIIPNYMGDRVSAVHDRRNYPGEFDQVIKVEVISLDDGKTIWTDLGKKKDFSIAGTKWSPDSRYILIDKITQDERHRWLLVASVEDGTTREIFHEKDVMNYSTARYADWSQDVKGVYFISDMDQYYHLYYLPLDSSSPQQLTKGQWEIMWMEMSKDRKEIFYLSTKDSPAERHLYSYNISKASSIKITRQPGAYSPTIAEDGNASALIYSNDTTPPDMYVKENRVSSSMKQITFSPLPEFDDYRWLHARYVTFKSHKDGVILHGSLLTPPEIDPNKKYPAFLGPVYSNTVRNHWESRADRSGFNQYLVQEKGYVQLLVDCRGSTGYGRKFRQAIVSDLGGIDLDDLVSGVEYLKSLGYVDASRIGIWGGSYGGFLTLMALFKYPNTFAAGIARSPVVNWMHDTSWVVRLLGTPEENPEAYRKCSPLYYAENLKGKLMFVFGLMDKRVLFQDTVQLTQKFLMANKDYDLVIAPWGGHGWDPIDEAKLYRYRRQAEFFLRHLGTGPLPIEMTNKDK